MAPPSVSVDRDLTGRIEYRTPRGRCTIRGCAFPWPCPQHAPTARERELSSEFKTYNRMMRERHEYR
jgi:hypothetical protein